jgi:multidrug efflux pump subunit AcrA (membrane-fusion protein)
MAPDRTQRVWVVVTEDGGLAAYPREITTGRASFDGLEVLSGDIRPGDLIVIRGNETLRMPGQRVNIRQSGTPAAAPAEPVS